MYTTIFINMKKEKREGEREGAKEEEGQREEEGEEEKKEKMTTYVLGEVLLSNIYYTKNGLHVIIA